jgi:broad specificity phosphatase PhoE
MRKFVFLLISFFASQAHADEALWKLLQKGGQVLFIRHATTAPGVGDPEGFRLEDCKTQRNLSEEGRAEARALGETLRKRKVPIGEVIASPWCRCIDTGQLAFGRIDRQWKAIGNLFGRPQAAQAQVSEMRARIGAYRGKANLVLISHGSTALALSGMAPLQAELIVLTPLGDGAFRIAGRLPPP